MSTYYIVLEPAGGHGPRIATCGCLTMDMPPPSIMSRDYYGEFTTCTAQDVYCVITKDRIYITVRNVPKDQVFTDFKTAFAYFEEKSTDHMNRLKDQLKRAEDVHKNYLGRLGTSGH